MFETQGFKEQLTSVISSQAGTSGMAEYETRIADLLQGLATENEPVLMESELRKTASSRRGIPDALTSTRTLIREASSYAIADRRKILTKADVEAAYRAKYCQVWPFCR
jgi:hypothetical protein